MPNSARKKTFGLILLFLVLFSGKIPQNITYAITTDTHAIQTSGSIRMSGGGNVTFILQLGVQGLGQISGSPGGEYVSGSEVSLSGVPSPGWEFSHWSGNVSGSANPVSVTMDSDKQVTATFTEITYTITSSAGADGSIDPDGATVVADGGDQSYTITPDTGYHILDVLVDSVPQGAVSTYDFTNVLADHTIAASFEADTLIGLLVDGDLEYSHSSEYLRADGASQDWYESRGDVPTLLTLDESDIAGHTGRKAAFTGSASGNAYLTQEFSSPQTGTFTAHWDIYVDNVLDVSGADRAGMMFIGNNANGGSADRFVYMGFWKDGGGDTGTMELRARETVDPYMDWRVLTTLNLDEWYSFDVLCDVAGGTYTVTVDGSDYVVDAYSTDTSVSQISFATWNDGAADFYVDDVAAEEFVPVTWTITSSAGADGSIDPDGASVVADGDDQSYTITPDTGYHILDVLVDSVPQGAVGTYDFTNVLADHTIAASFEADEYTLTVTIDGNGGVTLDPDQATYHYNDVVDLTALPDSGWEFTGWSGDLSGSTNPRSIVMDGDKQVTATFTETPPSGGILEVSNHDTNIEGGSGTNWQKTGENEFSFTLDWDITSPNYAEKYWFMYKVTGNAGGKTVTYDVNIQNTIGSRTGHTPALSYDNGNSWQYIPQQDISYYDNGNNHLVYTINFPAGQETALIAATIPIQYSRLSQYAQTFSTNTGYVSSYPSEQGRNVYVFTIDDGEPTGKPIMWVIAGQEPSEHWSQYMAQGFVEYLISPEASTLRQEHTWKIVPSINPDGIYLGKTQRNGVGTDLTTEWDDAMVGNADDEVQGLVDLMKGLRDQGYVFDGFIDLHVYYTDVWKIIRSTSSGLFDDYGDQSEFVDRISGGTYWGKDGIISSTNLQKSWGAIPNEFGCPTVLLEANQWRSDIVWNVPATINNMYYQGERLAKTLEGFLSEDYTLTLSTVGTGSVSKSPSHPSYVDGTTVTLTAAPGSGYEFTGWSGDLSGSTNPVSITMDDDKQVTATFTENGQGGSEVQILRFESQHSFGDDKANAEVIGPLVDMYDTSFYYSEVIPGLHDAGREVVVYWNFLSLWDGGSMFQQAVDNGWALVDSDGDYVVESGHTENKVMDIGSDDYRQMVTAWLNEQIEVGFDGVFADNSGFVYPQTDWLISSRPMNPRTGELYTDEDWLNDAVGYVNYVKQNTPDIIFVSNGMLYNGHEYYKSENTAKYDYFLENADIDILFVEGIFNNMGTFYDEQDWLKSLNLVVQLQETFLDNIDKSLVLWSQAASGIPVGMSEDQASLFIFSSSLLGVSRPDQNYISCHGNMDSEFTQSLFNITLGTPMEQYHNSLRDAVNQHTKDMIP